jgi:hypothetical protein
MTRPISLGLLPSGSDPVGEWNVHHQPPALYIGEASPKNKRRDAFSVLFQRFPPNKNR